MLVKLIFKKHKKIIIAFLIPNLLFLGFSLFYNKESQAIAQVEELGAETCFKEVPIGGAIDETEAFAKTILEQLKIMFEESARQEEAIQVLIPLFDECKPENCDYDWHPDYPDGCKKWTVETDYDCKPDWYCGGCPAGKHGCGICGGGSPPCLPDTPAYCCCETCTDIDYYCRVISRCGGGPCCPFDEMKAQLAIIHESNLRIKDAYNIIWATIDRMVDTFSDPDETEKYGICERGPHDPMQPGCTRKLKTYEALWPFLKKLWYWPNHITRREMILEILEEAGSQIEFCVTPPGVEESERTLVQCKNASERFLLSEIIWQCLNTGDIFPSIEACEFTCPGGTCQQIEGVHPSH